MTQTTKSLVLVTALFCITFSSALVTAVNYRPNALYLSEICYPLLSNSSRDVELHLTLNNKISSLANSPFPCEQADYIREVCTANGTTPIDFLAEQECLCTSSYWEILKGCDDCFIAHGDLDFTSDDSASKISSLSSAECLAATPPIQPYSNLFAPVNISTVFTEADISIGTDRFPNNTAVSNYYTQTGEVTPGAITGSATARLTRWTNYSGIRFTPTSTSTSATATATESGSESGPSSSAAAASTNAAPELKATGSLLVAVLGAIVML